MCDPRLVQRGITCNNSQDLIVPDGVWIGPFANDLEEIVVYECIRVTLNRISSLLEALMIEMLTSMFSAILK